MNILFIIGIIAIALLILCWFLFLRDLVADLVDGIVDKLGTMFPDAAAYIDGIREPGRLIYPIAIIVMAVITLIIAIVAWAIQTPAWIAAAFLMGIALLVITWFPAGVILKLFGATKEVIPNGLKVFISWVAFIGWLGFMCHDVLTTRSVLGAALVGLVFFGVASKRNALDDIAAPLTVIMVLFFLWGNFWPESRRSTVRFVYAKCSWFQAVKDRSSDNSETDAATTYAQAVRDINVLYELEGKSKLIDVGMDSIISKGTILKLVDRRAEIVVIDNQGFREIQLPNKKGNFVGGKKFYVEAEYFQLWRPRDVTPKDRDLLKNSNSAPTVTVSKVGGIFPVGEYPLALQEGEESDWCTIVDCASYTFKKSATARFTLTYEDGTVANSWDPGKWPAKFKFKVKNLNKEMPVLQVK